jgi:hypothetical protein
MSNRHRIHRTDQPISVLQTRIKDQKAYLDRLTVQGIPTQAATDLLNKLSCDLLLMKRHVAAIAVLVFRGNCTVP